VLLLLHIVLKDYRLWSFRTYLQAGTALLVILLPWYVVETLLHGTSFWYKHLVFMVWKRATETGFLHYHGPWYYVGFLWQQMGYLWPILLLLAGAGLTRLLNPAGVKGERELIGWDTLWTLAVAILTPLAVYSAAKNQTWWYILPSLPPLCIVGGIVIHRCVRQIASTMVGRWSLVAILLLLGLVMGRNMYATLEGQARNGREVYGARAELAKRVEQYVDENKMVDPLIASPLGESPSMASYITHRVEFDRDYLQWLDDKYQRSGTGILVIEKQKVLAGLEAPYMVDVIEVKGGWALAEVRKR
jgi:hypothetical protein